MTDRLWEIADIVKLVEDAEAKPGKRGAVQEAGSSMTPRAMIERIWGTHWGIRRALLVWLAMAAAFLLYAKLGGLEGNYAPAKAPFSRQACLNRETNYYRSRNPDMGAMSDELISRIAAICAREESDHYYSN